MILKLNKLDVEQLQDAYGAWFDETYERVWEEERRQIFHYVRRPLGRPARSLYRLRWKIQRWTHLVPLYALVKDHPEYSWDFTESRSRRRRLSMAWRALRCDFSSHSYRYQRPRYGYAKPIWKAD